MARPEDHSHHGLIHAHGAREGPKLVASLVLTGLFVVGEGVAGYVGNSLALLSDAGHNLADAVALGLAAYAAFVARRPANAGATYGYHRASILVALVNSASLVAIGVLILAGAVAGTLHPPHPAGNIMIWVAALSILMNTGIAWILADGASRSLNTRAAFLHMVGDALSGLAVVIAGLVLKFTGWPFADAIAAALIGLAILGAGWGVIRKAVSILLEATPVGLDLEGMIAEMRRVPLVESVHDVHAWTVSDGMHYLSCHVELPALSSIEQVSATIGQLNDLLSARFDIAHATIQAEVAGTCINRHAETVPYCRD